MGTRSNRLSIGLVSALIAALQAAPVAAQATVRASVNSLGVQGNADTYFPAISADGRYVAFESHASNLVSGDTNGRWDVFVRDRVTGNTERVSVDSSGVQGNGDCVDPSFVHAYPAISADGRYVAFFSIASNLVPGDTNAKWDIFVHDRASHTTERLSVDSSGAQGNGHSFYPSISADGRYVAFQSAASNLVAGDSGSDDIFVRDRLIGTTERISVDPLGGQADSSSGYPSISSDGRFVAYHSFATNLVAGDSNGQADIFVRDRVSGVTERASVTSLGMQANNASSFPSLSGDGRYVAFQSTASDLVAGDTNFALDVFVHDRVGGTTERISQSSLGAQANNTSWFPSMSADGRYVAFESDATNLVSGDTNGQRDIFLRDRTNGTTERISVDTLGTQGNQLSLYASISSDGRSVSFESYAYNLVPSDTNSVDDVFVRSLLDSGVTFCSPGQQGIRACPCAPGTDAPHDLGHGCSSALHNSGGLLVGTGTPVAGAATDTLVLSASDIGNGLTIFIEGSSAGAGLAFGDGVMCVNGTLKRFGTTSASARTASYPDDAGDPPISVFTGASAGQTKYYQVYYRSPVAWCNAATFNITNGYVIAWQ
jgi:Tol biopolymer transport system component